MDHWWEDDGIGDVPNSQENAESPVNGVDEAGDGDGRALQDVGVEDDSKDDPFQENGFAPIPSYPAGGCWHPSGLRTPAASIEALEAAMVAHGKQYGYGITRHQGSNPKPKLGLKYSRYRIYCARFGKPPPSTASTRKTTTSKTECESQNDAVFTEEGVWVRSSGWLRKISASCARSGI